MLARLATLALLALPCSALAPLPPLAPVANGDLGHHPGRSTAFLVEANQGGQAPSLGIVQVYVGRLVDVYDRAGVLRFEDLLIDPGLLGDGVEFRLDTNPVTQEQALTILHPFRTRQFRAALKQTQVGLVPLLDKGVGPNELPPFSLVPRNAALSVRFDDLLDDGGPASAATWPGTVTPENLRVLTGVPRQTPFEARVLPDPNHGDLVGGEFHSTRALVGMTHSLLQALRTGAPINLVGLPASTSTVQANGVLRIPTQASPAAGQLGVLTNLAGNPLSFGGNGSNDPASPTLDVVRAFRSGGDSSVTGDPFDGFLPDDTAPRVVGEQAVVITKAGRIGDTLALDLQFPTLACAWTPRKGDVVVDAQHWYEVTADAAAPVGGAVANVRVRLLAGEAPPTTGPAQYSTPWDPAAGYLPDCFVSFSPAAQTLPTTGVQADADVLLRFSEPMRPNSIDPFDAFTVRYDNSPAGGNPLFERVVGAVAPSLDLTHYAFQPSLPLAASGVATVITTYTVVLQSGGATGVHDLAGNALVEALPPVTFSLSSGSPTLFSKSLALRFSSADEDGNGAPELRGQFLYDFAEEVVRPRSVTRFSAQADSVQHPTSKFMVPLPFAQQVPLTPLGSRMMSVWRYHDLGFGLRDEATHNLDVEGLWWEPFGGSVVQDAFDEFEMRLAHSTFLPDEHIDNSLLPVYVNSGLDVTFDANAADAQQVVHAKSEGYVISPVDLALSPVGKVLAPWPMNRAVPPSGYVRWLWRDTASEVVGAPDGAGADTLRLGAVAQGAQVGFYEPDAVPSIGLPLLMEFKTYPSQSALGLNGFQVAVAINSSARPYFRTHSAGGVLANGATKLVDPDAEVVGTGGVAPAGNPTQPQDNAFYYGQADFVVRVSRMHTVWFDTLGSSTFAPPTLFPAASRQPGGTQVLVAFRGASAIDSVTPSTWEDANNLDPYGNSYTAAQHCVLIGGSKLCGGPGIPPNYGTDMEFTPTFFPDPGDAGWTSNLSDLDGARYVQARITMIANPDSGATPEVSALGLAFWQ